MKEIMVFAFDYNIFQKRTLTNLFVSRVLNKMLACYKKSMGRFTVFYLNEDNRSELDNIEKPIADYKRLFNLIDKTLKFPKFETSLSYEDTVKMLNNDCPQYDEIVHNHRSFAEVYPKLYNIVKKYDFSKIDREVINDNANLFAFLQTA